MWENIPLLQGLFVCFAASDRCEEEDVSVAFSKAWSVFFIRPLKRRRLGEGAEQPGAEFLVFCWPNQRGKE
jgi:hypothetical protein